MKSKPVSKKTPRVGFHYKVTQEQVDEHRRRSPEQILEWIASTNAFISSIQTEEEKQRKLIFKPNKKYNG